MKNLKRPIKKILTGVTCLIVVAATVALCSVAYFRETTQPENKAFTFTSVRVSQETSFQSKAPSAIFDGYDDKGYYVSLDRMSQATNLNCSTKVTNEGKKPIAIYAVVVYPYATTQNDLFANVVPVVGSKWLKISTVRNRYKNYVTAVFAYQELVQPGQTLEGEDALNMTITVKGTDETTLETAKIEVEDGYRKARIQTSMIGIQDPVTILNVETGEEYNWNLDDIDYGANTMLKEAWNYGINRDLQYYVSMNIKKIDDEISDDSKLK